MRLLFILLIFFPLLFLQPLAAQKSDSTITITDLTQDSVRGLVQNEFERYRDSMEALRIRQNVAKNGKSIDAFLQEMAEREKARKRQLYFRLGLAIVFLVLLVLGFIRWSNRKR